MTCPLCDAIRAGLPVTDDTPLPCRLRPTTHDPLPDDPFHGAVFDLPPGQKEFDPRVVEALNAHHATTTPAERVAGHRLYTEAAVDHLEGLIPERNRILAEIKATRGLDAHPLDALTRKD